MSVGPIFVAAATAPAPFAWVVDVLKVLLGAAIAFSTTWWFAQRAERARQRGFGYALVFRVGEAVQFVVQMKRMLTRNLAEVGQPGVPYKWLAVQVPAAFDWRSRIIFPPEELTIFAQSRQTEMLDRLGELARLHNIILAAAGEYAKRREELTDKLQALTQSRVDTGAKMRSPVTPEVFAQLGPDIAQVESLLEQLLHRIEEGVPFAKKLARDVGPAIQIALSDKKFATGLTFDDADRDEPALSAHEVVKGQEHRGRIEGALRRLEGRSQRWPLWIRIAVVLLGFGLLPLALYLNLKK